MLSSRKVAKEVAAVAAVNGSDGKDAAAPAAGEVTAKVEWAFPTKARCPRCGSTQSRVMSVRAGVRYRECQVAVCQRRWREEGVKI